MLETAASYRFLTQRYACETNPVHCAALVLPFVTGQIPQGGKAVPGNSEILIYLGEPISTENVEVPDFTGMNRQQASTAAGELGLYILVTGNREISTTVTVTAQDISPKTQVAVGSTIRLTFADTKAPD